MIVFIYFMGRKKDVHDKNKITKLLLPLLNNKKGLKVNAKNYFVINKIYPRKDWISR